MVIEIPKKAIEKLIPEALIIKSFKEVQEGKKKIPEPKIQRQEVNYGDAGRWKRTWMYFSTPTEFKIIKDWYFTLPSGQQGLIKEGFIYDGASIPFFLRPLMTSFGPLNRGGAIHDHGYRKNFLYDWQGKKIYVDENQKFWDDLFREVVAFTTHLKGLAITVWMGVRGFGSIAWKKRRKEQAEKESRETEK